MGKRSLPKWCCGVQKGVVPSGEQHLLVSLINEYNLKNIAEIGVFTGNLTGKVIRDCKGIFENYYCIDPWKPYPENYDREPRPEELTLEYWENIFNRVNGMAQRNSELNIIRKTSLEGVNDIEDRSLDIIYIDAIHDYENGRADILAWLDKVRDYGFVAGHDYLTRFEGLIKAIDEIFGMDLTVFSDSNWFVRVEPNKREIYKATSK